MVSDPPMLEDFAEVLREQASESKDYKERERLRALYALSIGQSFSLVAEIFCVTRETLHAWVAKFVEERRVSDAPRSGRPPALSGGEERELKRLVEENEPGEHGVNASAWDCAELVKYFARKGKTVSDETLRIALKRMGARYVKAVLAYPEASEQEREEFAKRFITELRGETNRLLVLFEDEMSAELRARKGYGWTFNERLVVQAPQANRERLNLFGAVSPFTGEIIQMTSKESKTGAFVRFLNKIACAHPRKRVWLYLDNLPVHRASKVKTFLQKHSNIQLKPLPRYSPELNPREYWHGFLRKKLLNNQSFNSRSELTGAIHSFTRRVPRAVVKNVCSLQPIYALTT